MKTCFLFLLLLLTPFAGHAQNGWYNFNTSNSGLTANTTAGVMHDSVGNLWIAYAGIPTCTGLGIGVMKFDGEEWRLYSKDNSGLPHNDIRAMACDPSGALWFGTMGGLAKFDGEEWIVYHSGPTASYVADIEFDGQGNMWIATTGSGISKFDGTEWVTYDNTNAPFSSLNFATDLLIDPDDNVWVAFGGSGGVGVLNTQTDSWTTYTTSNSQLPYEGVGALTQDRDGNIWMGFVYHNLIAKFDGSAFDVYEPFAASNSPRFNGLVADKSGIIWCGSFTEGLWKFEEGAWERVELSPTADIISTPSHSVVLDEDGYVWWVSQDGGVWTNSPQYASGVKTETEKEGTLYAMPNPFTDRTTLSLENAGPGRKEVLLFDLAGNPVRTIGALEGEKVEIERTGLPSGVYVVRVRQEGRVIATEKLIVE